MKKSNLTLILLVGAVLFNPSFIRLSMGESSMFGNSPQEDEARHNWWWCTGEDQPFKECQGANYVTEEDIQNSGGYPYDSNNCAIVRPGTGIFAPEVYDPRRSPKTMDFLKLVLDEIQHSGKSNHSAMNEVAACFFKLANKEDGGSNCKVIYKNWDNAKKTAAVQMAADMALSNGCDWGPAGAYAEAADGAAVEKILDKSDPTKIPCITNPIRAVTSLNNPFGNRVLTSSELAEAKKVFLDKMTEVLKGCGRPGEHFKIFDRSTREGCIQDGFKSFGEDRRNDYITLAATKVPLLLRIDAQAKPEMGENPDWTAQQVADAASQAASEGDFGKSAADTTKLAKKPQRAFLNPKRLFGDFKDPVDFINPNYQNDIEKVLRDHKDLCGVAIAVTRQVALNHCKKEAISNGGSWLGMIAASQIPIVGPPLSAAMAAASVGGGLEQTAHANAENVNLVSSASGIAPDEHPQGDPKKLAHDEKAYENMWRDAAKGALEMGIGAKAFGMIMTETGAAGKISELAGRTLYRAMNPVKGKPMSVEEFNASLDRMSSKLNLTDADKAKLQAARTDYQWRREMLTKYDKAMSKFTDDEKDQVVGELIKYKGIRTDEEIKAAFNQACEQCNCGGPKVASSDQLEDLLFDDQALACSL